ncbi:hypothetical protein FRC00_014028 [Tulasnella sp. 408]|nr:hypothetical protein FRC00_014028 [Tulasnella sp. 408]
MALILWPPSLVHDASCHGDTQQRCKTAFRNWWHSEISALLIEHQTTGKPPSHTYKRVKDRLEIASYAALAVDDDPSYRDKIIHGMTRKCHADGIAGCTKVEALMKENEALKQTVGTLLARDRGESDKAESAAIDTIGMDVDESGDTV